MLSKRFSWFPLLASRKIKVKETKSKVPVSNDINLDCANLLTINCVQELPVPENELAIVSATKECTSVEDRVMETNSKAAVSGLFLILPSL